MIKGMDCAHPLTAIQARALAVCDLKFAARYLVPENYNWKRLTRSEAEAITVAGMQIVSVFETTASRPAGGAAAGSVDGAEALSEARLINQPVGTAIYFAVDYDAKKKDFNAIEAYLRAAAKEIPGYKVGVYGSYAVIEEMVSRKAAAHFWQTYAWSGGRKSDHANIFQYKNGASLANVSLDLNESYGNEGWWNTKPIEEAKDVPGVVKPAGADYTAKIVVNDKLVSFGRVVDGRLEVKIADVLQEIGINYKWDNDQKKLYIYN
jgi:hypothetical protein